MLLHDLNISSSFQAPLHDVASERGQRVTSQSGFFLDLKKKPVRSAATTGGPNSQQRRPAASGEYNKQAEGAGSITSPGLVDVLSFMSV